MDSVIVIGGGAAGMAAAISAAMCGDEVTVLERMDRVGKKILATGNGRCNLMNMGELRFPGGTAFAEAVLGRCGAAEQKRFWEQLGLRMRQEDGGRVYPISGAASTVLDTLRQAMRTLGVKELTGVQITALKQTRSGWLVKMAAEALSAQRVIVAGGGCAQPKLGSDGSAWKLMTALGHRLVKPRPALTQVITDTEPIRGLSGVRLRTDVRITRKGVERYSESGELLFADYGLTGVCMMQCARYTEPGDVVHINMIRSLGFDNAEDFRRELQRRRALWSEQNASQPVTQRELLTGLCVPKVALALLKNASVDARHDAPVAQLSSRDIDRIVHCTENFALVVKGVKEFDSAQVTAGGLATEEFDPVTLSSRMLPGLHAAGEMLDVDGDCGGFNLMFAFGSGILAGLNGRKQPW